MSIVSSAVTKFVVSFIKGHPEILVTLLEDLIGSLKSKPELAQEIVTVLESILAKV